MSPGLRGPERNGTFDRETIGRRPIYLSGALFHDPKGAAALESAIDIVIPGNLVRMAGARPAHLLVFEHGRAFHLAEGIGISGREIEQLTISILI